MQNPILVQLAGFREEYREEIDSLLDQRREIGKVLAEGAKARGEMAESLRETAEAVAREGLQDPFRGASELDEGTLERLDELGKTIKESRRCLQATSPVRMSQLSDLVGDYRPTRRGMTES